MIVLSKKFITLSTKEKFLFFEAYITLGVMRAGILLLPFKWLTCALVLNKNHPNTLPVDQNEQIQAETISKAIRRAANHTPWESACLTKALTIQRMLRKRAIPGIFYLGVAKKEKNKTQLKAHAWVKCGNNILTGKTGHRDFNVISIFSWDRQL